MMGFELTKEFLELLNTAIQKQDTRWMEKNLFVLHHADIAAIINELEFKNYSYVYNLINEEIQPNVLVELDKDIRDNIIRTFSSTEIAEQLEYMDSDDAADFLIGFSKEKIEEIVNEIKNLEAAEDIVDLLKYEPNTAGGLMQKEFIQAKAEWPVNKCVIELRKQAEEVEKIFTIYVVDEKNKLIGYLSLKSLLVAAPKTKISKLYQSQNVISVKTSDDKEDVARIMERYDLVSVPVIDIQNKLVGRITIDDVVDVIKDEAEKDFQLASGISENIESSDGVWRISRARIPWLLIGLLGGVFGAQVISLFEGGISDVPQLAFFIPLITAMGGNVGVQSSAIVVQSLARGTDQFDSILKKLQKEALVSIINGLLLSLMIYGISFFFYNNTLGLVVSISLLTVIISSAIFGTLIPLLLDKYKIDPALATGPFITTLNDVLGLFIYLTIGVVTYGI